MQCKPNKADSEVHGSVIEMREKHSGRSKSRVYAGKHCSDFGKATESNSGMVRSGACSQVQLRALRPKSGQRAFHRAVGRHDG